MIHDELELVEWLRRRQPPRPEILLGIGDDMAVVHAPSSRILISSDMLLDGVHFTSGQQSWQAIGRKAVACSMSDCAAMAVRPFAALISLALPYSMTTDAVQQMMEGMFNIADEFDLAIAGGDTNRWNGALAIDVAMWGVAYEKSEPVTRAGARVGDTLYVTGHLGGSIRGRHLTFQPRVREAKCLAFALGPRLHAMIDITDGLSLDLWRLSQASGQGAELDEILIEGVASKDAIDSAHADGRSVLEHVLEDGEDFELLAAVEGTVKVEGVNLLPVGRITESGFTMRRRSGEMMAWVPKGYVH